ncbi:MAG: hypothetical protein OXB89_09820, partial [Anaerolineaceae bacterium]|nr:hypothetical protein [Anaerolineaceae bacterium]
VSLPAGDLESMRLILLAESAAAFDDMTRSGLDDQLRRQGDSDWPNQLRSARFIPAVEYIQANRYRLKLMQQMHDLMQDIDVLVTPCYAGNVLDLTNLTGHPALTLPSGFRENGTPTAISFIAGLNREDDLLSFATVYQGVTGWHRHCPPLFAVAARD